MLIFIGSRDFPVHVPLVVFVLITAYGEPGMVGAVIAVHMKFKRVIRFGNNNADAAQLI